MIRLPYGRVPYELEVDGTVLELASLGRSRPVRELVREVVREVRGDRVTVVVSDGTRDEPRTEMLEEVLARVSGRVTLAIATGTHGRSGFGKEIAGRMAGRVEEVVDHDGVGGLVDVGVTSRGTPVRVHRCAVEADVIVAIGCIRPHYFAGFGAGIKAVFPGLGGEREIRINHRLKTEARARAGVVDGNPCREDMEEAVRLVGTPVELVNGVCGPDHEVRAVVVGEAAEAFARGVAMARPWFRVPARTADTVIASDVLPVTASLYQASKIAAAVAPLVARGGTLVLVAECADGIGPVETVNRAIYEIGIRPRLAEGVRVVLVSGLPREVVATSYAEYAARAEDVVAGSVLVVPRASQVIVEGA